VAREVRRLDPGNQTVMHILALLREKHELDSLRERPGEAGGSDSVIVWEGSGSGGIGSGDGSGEESDDSGDTDDAVEEMLADSEQVDRRNAQIARERAAAARGPPAGGVAGGADRARMREALSKQLLSLRLQKMIVDEAEDQQRGGGE